MPEKVDKEIVVSSTTIATAAASKAPPLQGHSKQSPFLFLISKGGRFP